MTRRFVSLVVLALAALFLAAACERVERAPFTAEGDEPDYRRGKELIKQGRHQEALGYFQKVIERRGLNNSPDAHLEVGLLYLEHIRDPLAAIYHFRKYRELKPNSPQFDLVRQRIDAATREFAKTLPGDPMNNPGAERFEMQEVLRQQRREIDFLKNELATLRSTAIAPRPRGDVVSSAPLGAGDVPTPVETLESPVTAVEPEEPPPAAAASRVDVPAPPTRPAATPTTPSRRHIVKQKETLYSIARLYYGAATNAKIEEIKAANRDLLKGSDELKIGMELRIP
jgi:tetratricopeptide (TPR) repeat protein